MKNTSKEIFSRLTDHAPASEQYARAAGLSADEYDRLKRLLGRGPNKLELGIIGALWSEHCSYKSSRAHLSKLPTKGPRVLVGPGENAGIVDIGDGLAVVFKIESHNHPSFVEPFQGAATGVGGILRDIFTMGARPFAAANFLRFGSSNHKKVPYLVHGVVGGIASYGNCFGIPTVMSNVDFHESYNGNNLVNAFAIGVVKHQDIFLGRATGEKNRILYVGAKTGRDGIMGAVMASDVFNDDAEDKRPTVQVGDPFTEKLLLEACFLAFEKQLVVGIQDMGAAGLACSSFEMASRASTGLFINLDQVPLRDETMTAYDIMLSESQERMLIVAKPSHVPLIKEIFEKYELTCQDLGFVTGDGMVRINHRGREVAHLSATLIIENAPRYRRDYLSKIPEALVDTSEVANLKMAVAIDSFKHDLGQTDLSWITDQFDHHIGLNTLVGPNEADAALMMVPHSDKAVSISLTGNGRLISINPLEGARRTVFQAALEVSLQGANPIGITNCLNFGSPESSAVMTDFMHVIDGMAYAARELDVPIISGNVSFYNETDKKPILPTLALSLVGLQETPQFTVKFAHAQPEDALVLMGALPKSFAGCESVVALRSRIQQPRSSTNNTHNRALAVKTVSQPLRPWERDTIITMGEIARLGVASGLIRCAGVVGRGGLLHSLAKVMNKSHMGVQVDFGDEWLAQEMVIGMFSEDSPLIMLAIDQENLSRLREICADRVCLTPLGYFGGDELIISHQGQIHYQESAASFIESFQRGLGDLLAQF